MRRNMIVQFIPKRRQAVAFSNVHLSLFGLFIIQVDLLGLNKISFSLNRS